MDVEAATRRLLQPGAVGFLAETTTARRNGKDAPPRVVLKDIEGIVPSDVVVKRNVVFVEFRKGMQDGVIVASWNQQGRLANVDLWH